MPRFSEEKLGEFTKDTGLPLSFIPLKLEFLDKGDGLRVLVGHQICMRVEDPGHQRSLVGNEIELVEGVNLSQREYKEVFGASPVGQFHEIVLHYRFLWVG